MEKNWNVTTQEEERREFRGAPPPRPALWRWRGAGARRAHDRAAQRRKREPERREPRVGANAEAMSGASRTALHNHVAYAQPWTPCRSPHMLATYRRFAC